MQTLLALAGRSELAMGVTVRTRYVPGERPWSGDSADVMAEEMLRLRRVEVRRPGRTTRVASRPARANPAATNMASAVRRTPHAARLPGLDHLDGVRT